jgi:hypothetical protein
MTHRSSSSSSTLQTAQRSAQCRRKSLEKRFRGAEHESIPRRHHPPPHSSDDNVICDYLHIILRSPDSPTWLFKNRKCQLLLNLHSASPTSTCSSSSSLLSDQTLPRISHSLSAPILIHSTDRKKPDNESENAQPRVGVCVAFATRHIERKPLIARSLISAPSEEREGQSQT